MDRGCYRVGIVPVDTCAPYMALQYNLLPLSRFEIEAWHPDGICTIDGVYGKARECFGPRSIAELVIQRRVGLGQFGGCRVDLAPEMLARVMCSLVQYGLYVVNLQRGRR